MQILAIDAGTTGVTALVVDGKRRVVGRAYAEFAQHFPRPGWVEHDGLEILATVERVAKDSCKAAGIRPTDLAGVGITNQRETTVVWERASGKPIHHAIVWQDRRTAARCKELASSRSRIRGVTGLELDAYFSATKLEWLLANVPGARKRAAAGELAFGTIDSWLAWHLTGCHVTDVTNASRTMLYDIKASAWSTELLELFGVPEAVLPEVVPSSHVVGPVTAAWARGVPLAALVGDQQSALFGQRCFAAGQAKSTYGTGCFLLQHTGTTPIASKNGLLTTRAASLDATPQYALEGSVFVAGAMIQWLRDGLKMIQAAPETDTLAESVADSGGVVVVPALTGLGAPHWDAEARGAILGLTRGTTRAHIARATLEAIAFQTAEVVHAMEHDSGIRVPELRVDGGATQSAPLLQIQADLLLSPVVRPANVETTALGAAYLAGIAVGAWTRDDLEAAPGDTVVQPRSSAEEALGRMQEWHRAVAAVRAFGSR
jgi:glycerol kinase